MSAQKLRNSVFKKKFHGKTRMQTLRMACRKSESKHIPAMCNKIIRADILATSISIAAICGHCKNPKKQTHSI